MPGRSARGVVLARAVVVQHGGTLTYASAPGAGTRAAVRLPLTPLAAPAPIPDGEPHGPSAVD